MNLIICFTPLQILISLRLIEKFNLDCRAVIITKYNGDGRKIHHYKNLLENRVSGSVEFLRLTDNRFENIINLNNLKRKLNDTEFFGVYVASVDNIYYHYLLSKINFKYIFTYDDGVANIFPESVYSVDKKCGKLEFLLRRLFNIKYNLKDLKDKSVLHYTIYKSKNIFLKTKYINLIEFNEEDVLHERNEPIRIFLGQPIFFNETDRNKRLNKEVAYQVKADHFFPHPREVYEIEGLVNIQSDFIFEDYICNLLKSGMFNNIIVFSFFSSALFNLVGLGGVKVYAIDLNKSLPNTTKKLMIENGIEIIDLENDSLNMRS